MSAIAVLRAVSAMALLLLFLPALALAQGATCSFAWDAAADIVPGRFHHTTTMLLDGTLLAAGGRSDSTALSSARLYAEDTTPPGYPGRWEALPDMAVGRERHRATLLPFGGVLISGGIRYGAALRSCELYEPVSRSFVAFPDMTEARYRHTLTLLPNGRVLASGSENFNQGMAACEILVPGEAAVGGATASWEWKTCASMKVPRGKHTATLLRDGRVLVTGGVSANQVTSACEIYDPATDTWTIAPSMGAPRESHSATLLPDGRVYVIGGGSDMTGLELAFCEVFDPAAAGGVGAWHPGATLQQPRKGHAALLLGDRFLVVFGAWANGNGIVYCEIEDVMDPGGSRWQYASSMLAPRCYFSAQLLRSGRIFLDAGETSSQTGQTRCDISTVPLIVSAAPPPAPIAPRLQCSPNPAIGDMTITATAGPGRDASIEIVSMTGRVLRRLTAGVDGAPIAWDCRDDLGRRLAPGCYLVVFTAPERRLAQPVLLLR